MVLHVDLESAAGHPSDLEHNPLLQQQQQQQERSEQLASPPRSRRRRLSVPTSPQSRAWPWALAFYGPGVMFSLTSRGVTIYRNFGEAMEWTNVVKGLTFGLIQDAAVFLQALVGLACVLLVRHALLPSPSRDGESTLLITTTTMTSATPLMQTLKGLGRGLVHALSVVATAVVFFWMTLACVVDLGLTMSYMPRLNRGFVEMYVNFSGQFASSMAEALTPAAIAGVALYAGVMILWVVAILGNRIELPHFGSLVCQAQSAAAFEDEPDPAHWANPSEQATRKSASRRLSDAAAPASSVGLIPCLMHLVVSSATTRTMFLCVLVFVSAVHSTLALDGNGNDIYLMSNAMFSLETEGFLRQPARSHASLIMTMTRAGRAAASDQPELSPFMRRMIGENELLEFSGGANQSSTSYPFWRRTRGYTGKKRFDLVREKENASSTSKRPPPTILLINLESFRSLEVGVIGGREKKAQYNQTVTPFFDKLSESGVLFRQHYTPSVQTSRTLLSSLFGILPSLTDEAAVASFKKTHLRLYGLPQILKSALDYTTTFWSAVDLSWEDWRGFLKKNGFDKLYDETSVLDFLSDRRRKSLTKDDRFSWGRHDSISFEAAYYYLKERQAALKANSATKPLLMDIYTVSSHDPWTLPKEFKPSTNYSTYLTKDNEKYVNALNYVDQHLEKFITRLRTKGLLENTIVLIEGDHGYGRMEHDNPTVVASYVYDEGTHIPMLILADDLLRPEDKGTIVDDTTSQVDILATITDMLNITGFMQHGMGQSMMRELPEGYERTVVLENPFYGSTKGLKIGDHKYALYGSGRYEVFNLTSDPLEQSAVEVGRVGEGISNNQTATELKFLDEAMNVVQFMYEENGFHPSEEELLSAIAALSAEGSGSISP